MSAIGRKADIDQSLLTRDLSTRPSGRVCASASRQFYPWRALFHQGGSDHYDTQRGSRNEISPNSVVFPHSGSALVIIRIGL
jgi:hypothetical protein